MKYPEVLAFSRNIEVSDALMHSGTWSDKVVEMQSASWQLIELIEKRNRATHSQYSAKDDDKAKSNLSWGDDASLPHEADTLRVSFSVKFMGSLEQATSCNRPEFQTILTNKINDYREQVGFENLAQRYAYNLVNGRFLWRNRVGAESIKIVINSADKQWEFDSYDYPLNDMDNLTDASERFKELTAVIQSGLSGESFEYIEVTAYAKIGKGQRVWPSQEMVLNIPAGEKSRILFAVNGCSAMHSEKIGNAIRTIDTWYDEEAVNVPPIAIEPYGSVTTKGEAHRKAKSNSFYGLLDNWMDDKDIREQDKHYVIATLIRGGVFGGKD